MPDKQKNRRKKELLGISLLKVNIRTGSDEEAYNSRVEECDNFIYIYSDCVSISDHGSYEAEVIGREGEGWFGDVNN